VFPGGGDQPDLSALINAAQQMQEQLARAQQELAEARIEGSAGSGAVVATVTGAGELVGLTIDPSVIDPAEADLLADLVIAAVRDASRAAQDAAASTLGPIATGLPGGGLPGLPGGLPGLPGMQG
jgi:DNA-binding YbaB/EbfC family protein